MSGTGVTPRVVAVNAGRVREVEIHGRQVATGYGKQPVAGPVQVRALGLAGDEQADLSVHGGLEKAVYGYPHEHYAFWATVRAQAKAQPWAADPAASLPPGSFGENLTLLGLLESQVWVGDVLRFAHCALAVSAPRQPCFKFDAAMGFRHASKLMVQSGYCGFYLAVREPGRIEAGEACELIPGPREVSIRELFQARIRR
ncbi:MOSC domain-containing protein [Schlegelella sp. S2-27]|uniref:MOSC domain-containing protein n=1 Tax=Caldimonas mangrovi TaxID=2944811 RepID=A0ABT0YU90_9BURK|nr:MOSC domain-containing protein [Caldimonas mangrovi]MCM5681859.1 MOSC domain-containing protein [Caldimonas mangrovi]